MAAWSMGVDLGTTFTAAAVARNGQVEMVGLGGNSEAIPSVLALVPGGGGFVIGDDAERRVAMEPDRVVREFKRRIGDSAPILVGDTPFGAEALQAELLRQVVARASEMEGTPPDRVAVTHPANWGPYKRDLLTETIRGAGLDESKVVTLTEPEAAAIHYASQQRIEDGERIAVYDLGGGTFDVVVLERRGGGYTLVGLPSGVERLGGIDFDEALFEVVRRQIDEANIDTTDPIAVEAGWAALRRSCVAAKEALSTAPEAEIPIALPGLRTSVRMTRSEFEEMIEPTVRISTDALERALATAGVEASDLKSVLLVGGSSRVPLIGRAVSEALGRPVTVDAHPKFGTAKGAALAGLDPDGGGVAAAISDRDDTRRETDEASQPDGGRRRLLGAGALLLGILAVVLGFAVLGGGDDAPETADAPPAGDTSDEPAPDPQDSGDGNEEPDFDHLGELPVTDGLLIGLFADAGVELGDGQEVAGWTDLSSGSTFEPVQAAPQLIVDGLQGHDLIRFEESATLMEADPPDGLPVGNSDRTVIIAGSWGAICCNSFDELRGIGWGDPLTSGSSFFTGNVNLSCFNLSKPGILVSLGSGGSACFGSLNADFVIDTVKLEGAGSVSVGSRLDTGTLDLFFRNSAETSSTQTLQTSDQRLWIGGWPSDGEQIVSPFDVAVALVYERALTDDEMTQVVDHLADEYGIDA